MKYEALTKYIEIFEANPLETTYKYEDVDEGFLPMKYSKRSEHVDAFAEDVMKFVADNPELDLYHYIEIIDSYEPGVNRSAKESTDKEYLNKLDAKGILAWIVSAVRAECYKEGVLYEMLKEGILECWLKKLSQLDK